MELQRDREVSLTSSYTGVENSPVAGEKANNECACRAHAEKWVREEFKQRFRSV